MTQVSTTVRRMLKDSEQLAESDLELVDALQVHPRAPWKLVGAVLGRSPVTVARHYATLVEAGLVWTTAYPAPSVWGANCLAYVEISCEAARTGFVAETIARDPQAFTVEYTSGAADLFVTASFRNLADLSVYVRDRLGTVPGVDRVRTHLATRMFTEGSRWRVGALAQQQVESLRPRPTGPPSATNNVDAWDRKVLYELSRDARLDAHALAGRLSTSETTVRRRLKRLIGGDAVRLRCDVANHFVGWPVLVYYWAVVPAARIDEVGRAIGGMRETRLCVTLTGQHNLLFSAWLRSLSDSLRLERMLTERIPSLVIQDRSVQLHPVKRMGRLLDASGRAIGVVPMDPWREPEVAVRSVSGGMLSHDDVEGTTPMHR